ncbi:MAG: glycoside hydrolase family 2 TIM barrel-domain containing protein [Planctomycetota bacterium]
MKRLLLFPLIAMAATGCTAQDHRQDASAPAVYSGAIPVTVERTDDGVRLLRGGTPYFIKGAGGDSHLEMLVAAGGNSIRTWGADQLEPREWPDGRVMSLMDRAHELGLTVTAGFWVQHLPGGFKAGEGFDYDNPDDVQRQLDAAREFALKWKDHPALLMWGVGNEAMGDDRVRSMQEINRVAAVFKEADPDHPTSTVLAGVWPDKVRVFAEHGTDIDVLGINAYGGAIAVPQQTLAQGYDGPYFLGEYGPIGHWETAIASWGAEVEQSTAGKARTYEEFYKAAIGNQPDRAIGGYVFLWGNKQERTDTWYSMILPGRDGGAEKTAAVDVMTKLWTGRWPDNRAPLVEGIETTLSMSRQRPGAQVRAQALVSDPDNDPLSYQWLVRRESDDKGVGGAAERVPEDVPVTIVGGARRITVTLPTEPGAYRLHLYVRDISGGVGAANVPFYIVPE